MWVFPKGARHSKSLERRYQRTACLRGAKRSGVYQTWICGEIRGALGTARVWNGVVTEQYVGFQAAIKQGVH